MKKLADLLYGSTLSIEEIEKKYPDRNLPKCAEVTRFAPSPTGYLHIGHFFSALLDSLIAKSSGGIFYFRLEDTDKRREIEGAAEIALNTLALFDIIPDEGLRSNGLEEGDYGPYIQSKRLEIYRAYAKKLVEEGKAFPCFCKETESKDDVLKRREEELNEIGDITLKDPCRNLTYEEIERYIKEGKKFALRLKSNGDGEKKIKVFDIIKGEREIPANSKDIVLIKSNGIPVYAFAHAIDDHLMKTTIVVRGEEWFASFADHMDVYNALGFSAPKYLHAPVLCKIGDNGNKRKLSKRLDKEADMRFFFKNGYPKEAILEYLYNLLNSSFEPWRLKNSDAKLNEYKFDINKMGSSLPLFDMVKLEDIAKTTISKMTAEEVYYNALEFAKESDKELYEILINNKEFAIKVFAIDRYTPKPRKDIYNYSMIKDYYDYMFMGISSYEEIDNKENYLEVVKQYEQIYNQNDDKETWFNKIKELAKNLGYAVDNKEYKQNPEAFKGNVAKVCEYIRLALTGRKNSPDIYEIAKVLGKDEVIRRLKASK